MLVNHKVSPYIFFCKHHSFIVTFGFLTHLKLIVMGLEMVFIYIKHILVIIPLFTENVLYPSVDCFGKHVKSQRLI